jgi:AraC-like DNA-binding protein
MPSLPRVVDPTSTVSVRMLWPFARCLKNYDLELSILRAAGVDPGTFADPDARIQRSLARELIVASLQKTQDPCLGLHAGECVELIDFGPVDQMTRHCATLRDAILLASRYSRLQDDGVVCTLIEEGRTATLQIYNEVPIRPWVINEYQVASTQKRLSLFLHEPLIPIEVHMRHLYPSDTGEYARVFRAPVRCGTERNALVFRRELLDVRARRANPALVPLFARQATAKLERLGREGSVTDRVKAIIRAEVDRGLTAAAAAKRLSSSEATLRRRLAEEGTTYQQVLDAVRKELALAHLEANLPPAEIGVALGFSSTSSFARAFRRWTGASPTDYEGSTARDPGTSGGS